MCVSLPLGLTVQAAVVVLPVCAHGVLFTHKHHFSHTHLHQSCSLQGPAHTEQFLWTNRCKVQTHRMSHHGATAGSTSLKSKHYRRLLASVWFTHNYVFLCDPGVQVVHCYFCPLQRTESRLEKNRTMPHDQAYAIKTANITKHDGYANVPNVSACIQFSHRNSYSYLSTDATMKRSAHEIILFIFISSHCSDCVSESLGSTNIFTEQMSG